MDVRIAEPAPPPGEDRCQKGVGAVVPVPSAAIFWMKNRRPSEWHDVQQIDQAIGHYIISDRQARTKTIEAKANTGVATTLQQDPGETVKPLE
jgi:hypothetical protein